MSRSITDWIGKTDDVKVPASVRDRIARAAEDTCQHCRRDIRPPLRAEFDHIIPLILGGKHSEQNLQLLCHECHTMKTKLDVKVKAKVARIHKQRLGIKKPRTMTSWRRMDGTIKHAGRER